MFPYLKELSKETLSYVQPTWEVSLACDEFAQKTGRVFSKIPKVKK